jgi:hypothetical protein
MIPSPLRRARAPISQLLALLLLASENAASQARSGIVVDSAGAPVSYANVAVGRLKRVIAGADGRFQFTGDAIGVAVEVRRIGFQPLSVRVDTWPDTGMRFVLDRAATTLAPITVATDRVQSLAVRGFYERMADVERGINRGFFITAEEIEQRPGARVTDFLGGHPGVRVGNVNSGGRNKRWGLVPMGVDGCRMEIYLDGVRFYSQSLAVAPNLPPPTDGFVNDFITTNTIIGVEVYPRAVSAPPQYQSLNGLCGVILIWTR